MEKKYRVLHFIGTIYKILGVVTGILTIVVVAGMCLFTVMGGDWLPPMGQEYWMMPRMMNWRVAGGLFSGFISLISMGGAALTLFAFGEGIDLIIDLEANTRRTAELLASQSQPASPPEV